MKRVRMEPEYTLLGGILRFPTMAVEVQRHLGGEVNLPPGEMVQFAAAVGAAVLGYRRVSLPEPAAVGAGRARDPHPAAL